MTTNSVICPVRDNTPWELHEGVWVKREDLSCPHPGPMFSKVRGVWDTLMKVTHPSNRFPATTVGVVDSRHSKAGWGVAYLASKLPWPVKVVVYYPHFKDEPTGFIRTAQANAAQFGAELVPMPGGVMSAVLFNQARKLLGVRDPLAYMFPNGLKLPQSVAHTARELRDTLPEGSRDKNAVWVVSASSGTLSAGVCLGLQESPGNMPEIVVHLGYSRPEHSVSEYLRKHGVYAQNHIHFVDERYGYSDLVTTACPFPCNPYYDRKAWKWIQENQEHPLLAGKRVYFWNIGA